jgi:hypothetical protein
MADRIVPTKQQVLKAAMSSEAVLTVLTDLFPDDFRPAYLTEAQVMAGLKYDHGVMFVSDNLLAYLGCMKESISLGTERLQGGWGYPNGFTNWKLRGTESCQAPAPHGFRGMSMSPIDAAQAIVRIAYHAMGK